jgi:ERCC4-type nuclease
MSLTGAFIDSREPSHITSLKFSGAPVAITTLDAGDLWASTDDGQLLIIERKTPSDLLGSIKDGRLFQQVAAMRAKSKWVYLMITGALAHTLDGHVITDNRTTGWRFDDVSGALLTVQELGANIVICQSDQHYEEAVIRLARRDRKDVKPLEPRTQAHILTEAEKVLISLPGIGLERAGLLLGEHGSAAYSIAWLTWLNTFAEVSGIGDGTKHKVRQALGLLPDEWLSVMDTEKSAYAAKQLHTEASSPVLGVFAEN